jgi:hypothetical protein
VARASGVIYKKRPQASIRTVSCNGSAGITPY